jgi:hypothetical protein
MYVHTGGIVCMMNQQHHVATTDTVAYCASPLLLLLCCAHTPLLNTVCACYRTGSVRVVTASGECAVQFKCSPLPDTVSELLDNSPDAVRALSHQLAAERLAKLRVLTSSQTTASTGSSPLPPTSTKSLEPSPATVSSSSNGDSSSTAASAAAAATVADNSALVASLRKALVAAMKEQPDELIKAGVTAATTEPVCADCTDIINNSITIVYILYCSTRDVLYIIM